MTFDRETAYLEFLRKEARRFVPLPMPGMGLSGGVASIATDLDIAAGDVLGTQRILAASGASDQAKEMADYVCDGVNDEVEVEAARDDLPSTGGTLHFLGRTFVIEGGVLEIPENIWLVGHKAKLDIANNSYIAWHPTGLYGGVSYSINGFVGFEVTRSVGGIKIPIFANTNGYHPIVIIMGNWFHDIDCNYVMGTTQGGFMTLGVWFNNFQTINLRKASGGFNSTGIIGNEENPGRVVRGWMAFNYIDDITYTPEAGYTGWVIATGNDTSYDLGLFGNNIDDISGLVGLRNGANWAAHNMVADVMQAGHHANFTDYTATASVAQIIPYYYSGDLAVTTGAHRLYFPHAVTLASARAAVADPPTGSAASVDLLKNGTSVLAADMSIAAGTNVSSKVTPTTTAMADGDYLTVDITGIGATDPGSYLSVTVEYLRDEVSV